MKRSEKSYVNYGIPLKETSALLDSQKEQRGKKEQKAY